MSVFRDNDMVGIPPGDVRNNKNARANAVKETLIIVGVVLLALALRMLWFYCAIQDDEGFFAYHSWLWSLGESPYDLIDSNLLGPLMYLLDMIPIHFFGNTIIPIRIMNDCLFLISVPVLYMMVKNWFGRKTGLIAAVIYAIFMNAPVFQAMVVNGESLSVPFIIFAMYLCTLYTKNSRIYLLIFSGIMLSAASLIRQDQILVVIPLLIMTIMSKYAIYKRENETKTVLNKGMTSALSLLGLGVILPILGFILYFYLQGKLSYFLGGVFLNRFLPGGYLEVPDVPSGVQFLILAEGLPLWLLSIGGLIICIKKRKMYEIVTMSWFVFLFLRILLLPPHFDHHFAMVVPPAAVLSALYLRLIYQNMSEKLEYSSLFVQKQSVLVAFSCAVILLSLIPFIFLQIKQYPDLNIHWQFIQRDYSAPGVPWSYKEQLELADYIKANVSKDGKILVHSWWATPYFISGYKAPSRYVDTVKVDWAPTISDTEYDRILSMVENHEFEYIFFLEYSIRRLEFRRADLIVDQTLKGYFHAGNITTAQIFSKYNSDGEYISYSFIDKFDDALKEYGMNGIKGNLEAAFKKNNPIYVPVLYFPTSIGEDTRNTIFQSPVPPEKGINRNSYITYQDIIIKPASKLKFGITIDPKVWDNAGGDGVQFDIIVEDNEGSHEIFSQYLKPGENLDDRKWHDYKIDLAEYADKTVNISFVTNPGPNGNTSQDWALWSQPVIVITRN